LQIVIELVERAIVDGELGVRVVVRTGVRWKVLRSDGHPGLARTRREPPCERGNCARVAV
jgi:hypothetical protein